MFGENYGGRNNNKRRAREAGGGCWIESDGQATLSSSSVGRSVRFPCRESVVKWAGWSSASIDLGYSR